MSSGRQQVHHEISGIDKIGPQAVRQRITSLLAELTAG
jgi:hypothetical protein